MPFIIVWVVGYMIYCSPIGGVPINYELKQQEQARAQQVEVLFNQEAKEVK